MSRPEDVDALINGMCLTWRHDFGLTAAEPDKDGLLSWTDGASIGMTQMAREGLRLQMRQLYEHHIKPAILAAVEEEREACASLAYVEAVKHCSARDGMRLIGHPVGHSIASAIRARKDQ